MVGPRFYVAEEAQHADHVAARHEGLALQRDRVALDVSWAASRRAHQLIEHQLRDAP
jgi:hypothetical protein